MDLETLSYAVDDLKADVKEIKKDVKSLMCFMAVAKARDKRNVILFSGMISMIVSLAAMAIARLL